VLEVLYHPAKFGGARIPPAAGVTKNVEFFCLSVTLLSVTLLSVTLLNVRVCAPDFAMKALDRGRFAVVHPCSTLSDCCQLATTLNAEVQKTAKIGGFRQQRATE